MIHALARDRGYAMTTTTQANIRQAISHTVVRMFADRFSGCAKVRATAPDGTVGRVCH
jgi:hypothetical protein